MRLAIVYSSISGNTESLAILLHETFKTKLLQTSLCHIDEFSASSVDEYDGIAVGTYTWGNGEIPLEMESIYRVFERKSRPNMVTGVFGTGDSFYPHYCGAVNEFRDLLKTKTNLAVTLKVELSPQKQDHQRCIKFADLFLERLLSSKLNV